MYLGTVEKHLKRASKKLYTVYNLAQQEKNASYFPNYDLSSLCVFEYNISYKHGLSE